MPNNTAVIVAFSRLTATELLFVNREPWVRKPHPVSLFQNLPLQTGRTSFKSVSQRGVRLYRHVSRLAQEPQTTEQSYAQHTELSTYTNHTEMSLILKDPCYG